MPARGYEFYLRVFNSISRYRVEHEKIKFVSTNGRVIFCLLYKHTNDDVFGDFPKSSDHFPKISENFPKLFRRLDECLGTFSEVCRGFLKITEDFRGRANDVLIISNTSECFLIDYVAKVMVIMFFSRVKICLRSKAHLVFKWCLYNKMIYFCNCLLSKITWVTVSSQQCS